MDRTSALVPAVRPYPLRRKQSYYSLYTIYPKVVIYKL